MFYVACCIKKYVRTENELKDIFLNCCVGDILSILNGKMYRCPFSANAHNINAIPYAKEDVIDYQMRAQIKYI